MRLGFLRCVWVQSLAGMENDKRQHAQRRGLPRDDIPHPSATASLNASFPGRWPLLTCSKRAAILKFDTERVKSTAIHDLAQAKFDNFTSLVVNRSLSISYSLVDELFKSFQKNIRYNDSVFGNIALPTTTIVFVGELNINVGARSLVPRRSLLIRCSVTSQLMVESWNDRAENAWGLGVFLKASAQMVMPLAADVAKSK